jgi:hypothetical protein
MTPRVPVGERVWRVRKNHTWIDAQVHECTDGIEVGFTYDGARVYSRRFPTRDLALVEAARVLRDLQRAGWATHW